MDWGGDLLGVRFLLIALWNGPMRITQRIGWEIFSSPARIQDSQRLTMASGSLLSNRRKASDKLQLVNTLTQPCFPFYPSLPASLGWVRWEACAAQQAVSTASSGLSHQTAGASRAPGCICVHLYLSSPDGCCQTEREH